MNEKQIRRIVSTIKSIGVPKASEKSTDELVDIIKERICNDKRTTAQ